MSTEIEFLPSGSITSPKGFIAGACYAGIKKQARGVLDLGVLFSEVTCNVAAVFTTNRIQAAPVVLSRRKLETGKAAAVIVNAGCANACTGAQGMADAEAESELTAKALGVSAQEVLVASTGVIGVSLPMDKITDGIGRIALSREGGHELARAIMTTDTHPKEVAIRAKVGKNEFTIGGVAKGSGMIHPNLATMLCFLTTDAAVEPVFLKDALKKAVDVSLNMVSVDGDTSTNDTVLLMANGLAGNSPVKPGTKPAEVFQRALEQVCTFLAKAIARDGEGATRMIEVTVNGASDVFDARKAARTIISSPLVKTAVHGCDPNWGRVVAAAGRSGAVVIEDKIDLYIGEKCLLQAGKPQPFDKKQLAQYLSQDEVSVRLELNLGCGSAVALGCDLSEDYVKINAEYTT